MVVKASPIPFFSKFKVVNIKLFCVRYISGFLNRYKSLEVTFNIDWYIALMEHMSLVYTSIISFVLKIFPFQHGYGPAMVTLKVMFVKTFLVKCLFWQFLFFSEIVIYTFINISSSTKLCHGTDIVLLPANPTFYQIYHHFRITV